MWKIEISEDLGQRWLTQNLSWEEDEEEVLSFGNTNFTIVKKRKQNQLLNMYVKICIKFTYFLVQS